MATWGQWFRDDPIYGIGQIWSFQIKIGVLFLSLQWWSKIWMTKIGLTFALCNQINKIKDPNKQMPKTLLCQSNRFLKLDWTRKHIIIEFQDYKNKLFPHLSLLLSSSQLSNQTNSERGESYCIFTNMLGKEKKGSYHQSFLLQWWRRDNWTEVKSIQRR
jgi:hypothetical protein